MNIKESLYSKFSKYVKVDTESDPKNHAATPSTQGQWTLAKILAGELKELGLKNVTVTKYCYVLGELPSNTSKKMPAVGFIAHMDTAPDYSCKNVKPQLHKNYDGGKILVNAGKRFYIDPAKDPLLKLCKGHDIVTASGDTLLGGDDKAGIAVIMTMLEYFKNNPSVKHGALKVAFTPDEEIGHGSELLPLDKFKADFAYTLDGSVDDIGYGNFNADSAEVKITGVVSHPGEAKGVMVNPLLIAGAFINAWPKNRRPETTDKEQGFIHFNQIQGSIEGVTIKAIVREHDLKKLYKMEKDLKALAVKLEKKHPGAKIEVSCKESYRNMKDVLKKYPAAMTLLLKALKEKDFKYRPRQARGGTDGARLSFRGLPTPNMMNGVSGAHGPAEWASLDVMASIMRVCVNIVAER
jgi:tripeptide aminopeptidase